MFEKLQHALTNIQQTKPLIVNLTNYVTMDFMANSLLALGSAPIMSEEEQELAELVAITNVINLNIGTLNIPFLQRAKVLLKEANQQVKPVVLDPVGVGATQIRTKAALDFLPYADIIRGNASEIMALSMAHHETLGVESIHTSQQAVEAAKSLCERYNFVVVISGATDIIVTKDRMDAFSFGSPLMACVTGMGCVLTAVIGVFRAVEADPYQAALLATVYFSLCGEQAAQKNTVGSFKTAFVDSLYAPNLDMMRKKLR